MRTMVKAAALLLWWGLLVTCASAQDTAEAAMANSRTAATATHIKPMPTPKITAPATTSAPTSKDSSPHFMARTGPPPDEVNRKDFEDNAGDKAGKLFIRSVPTGAQIFVNDLLVGKTPLLMVVAPGKYKIDMRGPREESGHRTVGVMPKETETVVINLNQRYPGVVLTH